MNLQERLTEDLRSSTMRGDESRHSSLWLLPGTINNAEVERCLPLDDAEIARAIEK